MAHFKAKEAKIADDGIRATIYRESCGGWYVGRDEGEQDVSPIPMGAFSSRRAARRWCDQRFPGGVWTNPETLRKGGQQRPTLALDGPRASG